MTVGERIKGARKTASLTQDELAARLGVTQAVIGQYERGIRKPKMDTIQRIADALGIGIYDLVPEYSGSLLVGVPKNESEKQKIMDDFDKLSPSAQEKITDLIKFMAQIENGTEDDPKEVDPE